MQEAARKKPSKASSLGTKQREDAHWAARPDVQHPTHPSWQSREVRRSTAEELGVVDKLPAAAEGADADGAEAPAEDPKITLWNCYSRKAANLGKEHRARRLFQL